MAWYTGAINKGGAMKAGRSDLLMATYLPYCDRFVSDDKRQTSNLHEIAREAQINCEVTAFSEFLRAIEGPRLGDNPTSRSTGIENIL
jgi:hypothetical protein